MNPFIIVKPIGLESLQRLLKNDPKIFNDYYDFLLDCYKKGDMHIKIKIANIFSIYLSGENVEDTVNIILSDLQILSKKSTVIEVSDKLIDCIITICSKDYYKNI